MTEERKEKCCAGGVAWPMALSLALNLFLVGVVVGPMLRGDAEANVATMEAARAMPMPPPRNGGMPGFMLDQAAQELAPAEAQKLRSIFEEERDSHKLGHEDRRRLMQKIASIMKMDKPDMDSLRKVLDEIRASGQGLHEGISRAMQRVAAEISPEGRRKIARVMEEDRGPGFGPNGNLPPPPPPEQ